MTIKAKLKLMEQMKRNNKQHVDNWKNNKK
jgi:hypothetical protein